MTDERAALLPIISKPMRYSEWKDIDDVGIWFRDAVIEYAKQWFLDGKPLGLMVNALGVSQKASARVGRLHPKLVQYAMNATELSGSHEDRDILEQVLPQWLKEIGAFYVVTVMVGWTAFGSDVRDWYKDHDSLEEHPSAKECLNIVWERKGEQGLMAFPISRDGDTVEIGEDLVAAEYEGLPLSAEGRFANVLSDAPKGVN